VVGEGSKSTVLYKKESRMNTVNALRKASLVNTTDISEDQKLADQFLKDNGIIQSKVFSADDPFRFNQVYSVYATVVKNGVSEISLRPEPPTCKLGEIVTLFFPNILVCLNRAVFTDMICKKPVILENTRRGKKVQYSSAGLSLKIGNSPLKLRS